MVVSPILFWSFSQHFNWGCHHLKAQLGLEKFSPWWFTSLLVLREKTQFPPTWASPRAPWVSSWHSSWSFPKYVIWTECTELHADARPFLWTSFYILFIRTKSLKLAHIQREGLLALHFEGVSVRQSDTLCVFPMPSFCSPGSCSWVALLQPRLTW